MKKDDKGSCVWKRKNDLFYPADAAVIVGSCVSCFTRRPRQASFAPHVVHLCLLFCSALDCSQLCSAAPEFKKSFLPQSGSLHWLLFSGLSGSLTRRGVERVSVLMFS